MPLVRSILSVFSAAVLVLVLVLVMVMLCLDLDTSALITSVRSQAAAVQSRGSSSSMLQVRKQCPSDRDMVTHLKFKFWFRIYFYLA